jgi:hypothetical protein
MSTVGQIALLAAQLKARSNDRDDEYVNGVLDLTAAVISFLLQTGYQASETERREIRSIFEGADSGSGFERPEYTSPSIEQMFQLLEKSGR